MSTFEIDTENPTREAVDGFFADGPTLDDCMAVMEQIDDRSAGQPIEGPRAALYRRAHRQVMEHLDRIAELRTRTVDRVGYTEDGTPFGTPDGTVDGRTHSRRSGVRRRDPWSGVGLRNVPGSEVRSRALDAIEAQDMPDAAREAGTRAVEDADEDERDRGRMARYTLELSSPAYRRAFLKWMRDPVRGHLEWSRDEQEAHNRVRYVERAMSLGTPGSGGFLVPYALDPQIMISNAGYVDPMRQVARVEKTVLNEQRFVTSTGVTASWDAEAAEVSDDTPALLQPAITSYKGAAFLPVSYELFEDSDISRQVAEVFADAKASLEATAFTTGTGTGQPKGIITALVAAGGSSVIATGTNVLAQADLYANQASLPPRWRQNAKWMMNLSIINGFRQLPQATGLNYSIINDNTTPPKALGWDVIENGSMDGALTGSAADYAVLSGDFRQYIVTDRLGTSIELINHLFGAAQRPTGQRGFYMHWRTGGDVVIPDAFRLSNYST
ncbi:phage major capsid protein [Streptomyces sp. ActVer]|uniref:phage major capsid protein n=1 Tax=Streptomyces sp. ActVer TaxID=3014558 RepID=UPI0022B2E6FB|nr:phage major capsid protein [Streptomyces sp. ActVer]MCZ4509802.1 phage major capsid protein [Streptomyces sp. ActVer]